LIIRDPILQLPDFEKKLVLTTETVILYLLLVEHLTKTN